MPRGDRTGPWGQGPMTGRRMGYCAGFSAPGFTASGPGLGYGRGFGFGRGFARGYGLGMGRGWRRGGFGRFRGYPYPSMMPSGYPYGMPYDYPAPPLYGYPYREAYGAEYPPQATSQKRSKKQNKETK